MFVLRSFAVKKMYNTSVLHYHTLHGFCGLMGEPTGQLNAAPNSSKEETEPNTRNLPGECSLVLKVKRFVQFHTWHLIH